jgi:hypothetical protein
MLTRADRKTLFTALAFFAVTGRSGAVDATEGAANIRALAGLVESFCADNAGSTFPGAPDETGAHAIDEMIERHIAELRDNEVTRLPDDRAMLIKCHDRLAHRKARRQLREFYGRESDETLAEAVLALLDEEINRSEKLT